MTLKPDLTVPEQKTASLSYCGTSTKAFDGWVQSLPMANIGEASRQLYHAVIELNQLIISPQQRLQLLDLLRPQIHFVCEELSRHYFGHSISLPEKPKKIANLSQALQLHLANGYKLCVLEFIDNGGIDKNRKALAISCHRAISELGATIVRSYQLYCPSPARSWLECHRLFRFAKRNKFDDFTIEDSSLPYRKVSKVGDCYKRILLLGCARPNQLRQNELALVYVLFDQWSQDLQCDTDANTSSLFVVDMERDAPPIYRSLLLTQHTDSNYLNLDTQKLSDSIFEQTNPLPSGVSDVLLAHLSQALSSLTKRSFSRMSSQGTLEVCVGLTAAHYFISGQKTFNQFVTGNDNFSDDEENSFISASRRKADAWSGVHDADQSEDRLYSTDTPITFRNSNGAAVSALADKNTPKVYRTSLINTSPGGYCVAWEQNIPSALQAGEVLGIREQPTHPWSVAVVRWLRQVRGQGTLVGVELLAPSASAAAVRLIQKVGNSSEYLRSLLLPEISVVNQAATLITPRLPFQFGSRITLIYDGREDSGKLATQVRATGSISQFELKLQGETPAFEATSPVSTRSSTSEDEFDSLWPSL